jgi:hypothetical protein
LSKLVYDLGPAARDLIRDLRRDPALLVLYLFNERGQTYVYDRCSRNRLNLTQSGGVTFGGTLGSMRCVTLDGSNDYLSAGNQSALDVLHNTSVSYLSIAQQDSSATGVLFSKIDRAADKGHELNVLNSSKTFYVLKSGTGAAIEVVSSSGRSTGTPYMLGVAYGGAGSASDVAAYVNGAVDTLVTSSDTLSTATANSAAFCIGAADPNKSGGAYFPGKVSLFAMFNEKKPASAFKRWASLGRYL